MYLKFFLMTPCFKNELTNCSVIFCVKDPAVNQTTIINIRELQKLGHKIRWKKKIASLSSH